MTASIERTKRKIRKLVIFLFKYNQPKTKIPTSISQMGGPIVDLSLISCLFIMPFDFGYVDIFNSGLNKCIYQKQF